MDLHGTDDWIFDELENVPKEEVKPARIDAKPSDKQISLCSNETNALKQTIRHYELKQKTNEAEKHVFLDNFYKLLVTARTQIKELEQKNADLTEKLSSYTSVKCPKCEHCFRSNDSRLMPKYVRYISACHRLELDFENGKDLKQWLNISNLDTDVNGVPVIRSNSPTKSLTGSGSLLVAKCETKSKHQNNKEKNSRPEHTFSKESNSFRMDVENLSSRFSIRELKEMFEKVGPVSEVRLSESENNKAVVYFQHYRHLRRTIEKYQNRTLNGRRIKLVDRYHSESSKTRLY